jgi:FkbM family methyltransferase
MVASKPANFGALRPGWLDRAVLAATTRLPDSWIGLRLAILLRRVVTMRLPPPDGALDVERWGMRLRLHPRDNGCEKNLLFTPQMYETTELRELAADIARVRSRGAPYTFVDIGANVGLFSVFVAAETRRRARILAIEPEPGNVRRLNFNIRANPDLPVTVIATALSDDAGKLAIALNRSDRGGSRTLHVADETPLADAVQVPAQTLLAVLAAERMESIDAVKIDVEGMEDKILAPFFRQAPRQLWPGLIIIEDSRPSWSVDLMALLAQCGYAVAARTKQNVVLRRMANEAVANGAATGDRTVMDASRGAR